MVGKKKDKTLKSDTSNNRAFITESLTNLLHNQFGVKEQYASHEITIYDKNGSNLGRVDYIIYKDLKTWKFYEIKSCKEDFYSNSKWTFLGHYNYFVFSKGLYEEVKNDIPNHIGVYEANTKMNKLKSVKRAKKQNLPIDEKLIYNRFIASLSRDAIKYFKIKNDEIARTIRAKNNEINRLRSEVMRKHAQLRDRESINKDLMIILENEGYSRKQTMNKLDNMYNAAKKRDL